jgi:hypothetical protein
MIKVDRIVKGTTATLLVALAFVTTVWAQGNVSPPRDGKDSTRLVKLRLTFESGDWATVTQFEGVAIRIEKNGKKLAVTPYIREQGQVELKLFQVVQREGKETMNAAGALLVGKELTKLEGGGLVTSVQVLDANKKLTSDMLAMAGTADCCVTTCDGTLICGFCVCTDCFRCGPRWCECANP